MTMGVKENQCGVTTAITNQERELLIDTARELDIPYYVIMRKLIRYILDGKITWMDLFQQSNELSATDGPETKDKKYIRTQLNTETYAAFSRLAEEWGTTTSIVLRRLMLLYISGKIEREAIWY
jgi:hypothetical protein